jgi:DNA-binding MarR family transcriptional regulator
LLDISSIMNSHNPVASIFYSIEEAIKAYRKLSLKEIKSVISDITVDQALILQMINDKQRTQTEIADLIFKDYASMTRIIGLMVKKDYLIKTTDENDRRASILKITFKGEATLKQLTPIIKQNRETALKGLTIKDLSNLKSTLNKINQNCKK